MFAQACINVARCVMIVAPLVLLSAMADIAYKCECGKYFWNKADVWNKEQYKTLFGRFSQHASTCAPLQRLYGEPEHVSQWHKKLENRMKPGIYDDDGEFIHTAPAVAPAVPGPGHESADRVFLKPVPKRVRGPRIPEPQLPPAPAREQLSPRDRVVIEALQDIAHARAILDKVEDNLVKLRRKRNRPDDD